MGFNMPRGRGSTSVRRGIQQNDHLLEASSVCWREACGTSRRRATRVRAAFTGLDLHPRMPRVRRPLTATAITATPVSTLLASGSTSSRRSLVARPERGDLMGRCSHEESHLASTTYATTRTGASTRGSAPVRGRRPRTAEPACPRAVGRLARTRPGVHRPAQLIAKRLEQAKRR